MIRAVLVLLVLTTATLAQTNHAQHHAIYQSWVNKLDKSCCNNRDCGELADANERTSSAGTVEVWIEGKWCPVQAFHYLKRGNAPDWSTSHVCVQKKNVWDNLDPCPRLLCYQPKPGI